MFSTGLLLYFTLLYIKTLNRLLPDGSKLKYKCKICVSSETIFLACLKIDSKYSKFKLV